MASKLVQRKLETQRSLRSMRKICCDVQVCATSLVLSASLGVLIFCFVFVDMRTFYQKTTEPVILQKSLGAESMASRGAQQHPRLRVTPYIELDAKPVRKAPQEAASEVANADEGKTKEAVVGKELVDADYKLQTIIKEELEATKVKFSSESDGDGITSVSPSSKKSQESNFQPEVITMAGGQTTGVRNMSLAECNISQGRWVYDDSYPLYRTQNCPFADAGFRCEENGRPDSDFMKYRWQPHHCNLPRFNATEMLKRLRGQRVVFVGDSLGRNHWESMLCMLAEGVGNKSRIYEVNGQPITKHTGELIFKFEDFNCTVEYYRDPFLVPQSRSPPNSPSNVTCAIKVDEVAWSAEKWRHANILIFNAGHWWTNEKIFRQGCGFQVGRGLKDYDIATAFKVALQNLMSWLDKNIDPETTQVIFRSYATIHFRGGDWNKGGHCDEEVRPLTEEEARSEWQEPWTNKIIEDVIKHNIKAAKSSVSFMDITTATNYRSDGHGALYYKDIKINGPMARSKQDCSHYCLPGVPDMWSELLFASLLARGQGAWGQPVRY